MTPEQLQKLKDLEDMLLTNQEVDWTENDPNFEFSVMAAKLNLIIKDLEKSK